MKKHLKEIFFSFYDSYVQPTNCNWYLLSRMGHLCITLSGLELGGS